MQARVFRAYGRRFVHLGGEAVADLAPDAALRDLLGRFGQELALVGMSLEDTVRTRLWAPTAADRLAASSERRSRKWAMLYSSVGLRERNMGYSVLPLPGKTLHYEDAPEL